MDWSTKHVTWTQSQVLTLFLIERQCFHLSMTDRISLQHLNKVNQNVIFSSPFINVFVSRLYNVQ